MSTVTRLSMLRESMLKRGLDAYIIPSSDAHQSEYVAEHWKSRAWISGFTGSAGTVVVTQNQAGLWTDSRYFLQAETELKNSTIVLHKPKDRFAPEYVTWLASHLERGSTVGLDGNLCSILQYESYKKILSKNGIILDDKHDLFQDVWSSRQPLPSDKIFEHDLIYSGLTRVEKIEAIRTQMKSLDVDHHLVSTLDDIAWIFNIRGNDIEFNPLAICYALISMDKATLFIASSKVPEELNLKFSRQGIEIKPYSAIREVLNSLFEKDLLLLDPATCNVNIYKAVNSSIHRGKTPSQLMKACKNEVEIEHTRNAMANDGAALAKVFYWIEQSLKNNASFSEADIAEKLAGFRAESKTYFGESFPAIVGYRSNGAIIHYRPMHETCSKLKAEGLLLLDSGGQYFDGTTDVTRTITLGNPTAEEKRNFTLVLKGNIALSKARFPEGTTGAQLDTLARKFLWAEGLDYSHGTGHGVGFFLNVHEPPQGFAGLNSDRGRTPHLAGMITSNEPGYYKEGAYGIRIENLLLTVESEHKGFLEFETLSLYPIDHKLIDDSIFSKSEKQWLNNYHKLVLKRVSPLLEGEVKAWFEHLCRPVS